MGLTGCQQLGNRTPKASRSQFFQKEARLFTSSPMFPSSMTWYIKSLGAHIRPGC